MDENTKYMIIDEEIDEVQVCKESKIEEICEYYIETADLDQTKNFNDCEIKIHFNPFLKTMKCFMLNKADTKQAIKLNKANISSSDLDLSIMDIFEECKKKQGYNPSYSIGVSGSKYDVEDFRLLIDEYNRINNRSIGFVQGKVIKNIDRMDQLKKIRKNMASSGVKELEDKRVLDAIDDCINEKNQLVVCATMSSGKSSLINSFLSNRLMPSKNEACTAKIVRLKADNRLKNFVDSKGTIINEDNLMIINDDENGPNDIHIKGPIKNFEDIDNFEIIDTPGPNNSLNSEHKTVTYDFIKSDIKPLTIFLLDATKLLTTDDDAFLSVIAEQRRNKGKINQDRFIFVVNKCDQLNLRGRDSIENIEANTIKKLEEHGIYSPKLHFVSARNSLLARMEQEGLELDDFDLDDLDTAIRRAKRGSATFYKKTNASNSIKNEVERVIAKAIEENDELTLVIATSGILGLELAIKEFMGKHKKFRAVNKVYNLCSRALENNELLEELKGKISENKEKADALNKTIVAMKKKIGSPEKMYELINEVKGMKFGDTLTPIEKKINKELDEFRIAINKMPTYEANGKVLVKTALAEQCMTNFQNRYSHLKANLQSEFTASVNRDVVNTINSTMSKYTMYLSDVFQGIKVSGDTDVKKYFQNIGQDYIKLINKSKVKEMVVETHLVRNPQKEGFFKKILFFWKDDYVNKYKVKTVEGVEIEKMREALTNIREDLYGLYNTIQKERKKTEERCIEQLSDQVIMATQMVLTEMDKITELSKKKSSISKNVETYSNELNKKRKSINGIKTQVRNLVKVN